MIRSPRQLVLIPLVAWAAACPMPAGAQSRVDITTSNARQRPGGLPGATLRLAPRLHLLPERQAWLDLTGFGELRAAGLERGSFRAEGGVHGLGLPWLAAGLQFSGGANGEGRLPWRTRIDARGVLRAEGHRQGAWLGAGRGRAWHGVYDRGYTNGELGGWVRLGLATLRVSWEVLAAGTALDAQGRDLSDVNPALRSYTLSDARAELGWDVSRIEFTAYAGQRFGRSMGPSRWGGVHALVPLAPGLALVARHEREPMDPLLHQPDRTSTSLGFRVGQSGRAAAAGQASRGVARAASVSRDSQGRAHIAVEVAGARAVELLASFNDWVPVPLERDGQDWWRTPMPVAPGLVRLMVRVDGGAWQVPGNLPAEPDEFLGSVGLLTVAGAE